MVPIFYVRHLFGFGVLLLLFSVDMVLLKLTPKVLATVLISTQELTSFRLIKKERVLPVCLDIPRCVTPEEDSALM
jgi:hypothetical protein